MGNVESMYEAIRFIESNLKKPLKVQDVSLDIGYSLYHFTRVFSDCTGHSPYDYIIRRRLSEAARELLDVGNTKTILDISLEHAFQNPETFSRAFRKMFGILPRQARKTRRLPGGLSLPALDLEYMRHINQSDIVNPEILELDSFRFLGLMGLLGPGAPRANELWTLLRREIAFLEDNNPGVLLEPDPGYYGLRYLPESPWPGENGSNRAFYMAALKVPSLKHCPGRLVGKKIPRMRYARFLHRQDFHLLSLSINFIYHTWLPSRGAAAPLPFMLEIPDRPEQRQTDQTALSVYEILVPLEYL